MSKLKNAVKNIIPYGIAKKRFEKPVNIISSDYPSLYNNEGEEMLFCYLKEPIGCHNPYSLTLGRMPRRIVWDRNNYALDCQMYGHTEIIDRMSRKEGVRQFGLMIESEIICPHDYKLILNREDDVKSLDAIFTFSERLLDKYENARFSLANGVWYGTKMHGGIMEHKKYEKKTKLLSAIASSKRMCPMHVFRAETARELKRRGLADVMGAAVGARFEKISDAFDDYMYNVAIENESTSYYFTEKILDCFASMTVPVYYGARKIEKFFNLDGVIIIKEPTIDCVIRTIGQCSEKDYISRIPAIIENYERVQQYLSVDDYLTENYWDMFVK